MNRTLKTVCAAAGIVLLSACNGWPGTMPLDQAVHRPEKYPTYMATAGHPVEFYAGNHRYMVMPTESSVRGARTASVSTGAGVSVFALEGDDAPYAALFARTADGLTHDVAAID